MPRKRALIIGAGASGITALKACVDEGIEPLLFERHDFIGGLWQYNETNPSPDQGSVYKSTIINTSKEMMCYSDYPIPKAYPNFMHNTVIVEYFRSYVRYFGLNKYIRYHHSVKLVRRSDSFSEDGSWTVDYVDGQGEDQSETFDGVFVCTGHHAEPFMVDFDGLSKFKGHVTHSHDYKTPYRYDGQRVLVVGIGNSGGDISVELGGRAAKRVFLSTRRGAWVFNRVAEHGMPVDIVNTRRWLYFFSERIPKMVEKVLEGRLNAKFDHAEYGLKPAHGALSCHPMVNDEIPNRILSGAITLKPDIKRFTESSVVFADNTEENIDAAVICTGYSFGFPFLEPGVSDVNENRWNMVSKSDEFIREKKLKFEVNLYKYVFPPHLGHCTLGVIGCIQPLGAINPISELQCRWLAGVISGRLRTPSKAEMEADIKAKRDAMAARYVHSRRHTIQVDWITYMDELAYHAKCLPPLKKLFFTDPKLFAYVFFGPCTPYQYRLAGEHQWSGAREAIFSYRDRVLEPLRSRQAAHSDEDKSGSRFYFILLVGVLLVALLWRFCNCS